MIYFMLSIPNGGDGQNLLVYCIPLPLAVIVLLVILACINAAVILYFRNYR